jgi:outer membrane protein TolC
MKRSLILALGLVFVIPSATLAEKTLPLGDYLRQVKAQGPDYLRAVKNRKTDDLYRTTLGKHWNASLAYEISSDKNTGYSYSYNDSTNTYSYFSEDSYQYLRNTGRLSFSNDWGGLFTGLYYNAELHDTWYSPSDYYSPSETHHFDDDYGLYLRVPLWRNFLGRETNASDKGDLLNNEANASQNEFQIQSALYDAKRVYYALARNRTQILFARESLEKYHQLLELAKSSHDRLQAQAALENLELGLESLEDSERQFRNDFNRLRGAEGSQVPEVLQTPEELDAQGRPDWPGAEPGRLDLKASQLYLEAVRDFQITSDEGTKLGITLIAQARGYGFGWADHFPGPPPISQPLFSSYNVGLNFSVPFDVFTPRWTATNKISLLNLAQQELDTKVTQNNDSRQWEDMTLRYNKSSERIAKAELLEQHSKEKQEAGESLFRGGSIGMFEMLNDVGAYYNAKNTRQHWVMQRLDLLAQAEWYKTQTGQWKKDQAP